MKRFIIKSLIFTIILLLCSYPFYYVVNSGIKKTGEDYSTWNDIISSSVNADVIIHGSSRSRQHVNPLILDSILHCRSYNIGIEGSQFNKTYVRYFLYDKFNKKPDFILQQVDYITFSIEHSFDHRFLPYISDIDKNLVIENLEWVKNYHFILPISKYIFQKKLIIKGLLEYFNIKHYPYKYLKGFEEINKTWDGILSQDELIGSDARNDTIAIDLFDSFLNYCNNKDIQVILFFSPQYYWATEAQKGNKEEIINIYNSLSEKYGFCFLNYLNDSICFNKKYFYNPFHLNKEGAKIFSIKLARDLDSLGIIKY